MTYLFQHSTRSPDSFDYVQKFGRIPDIDSADTNEDVWDGTGAYAGFLSANTAMTISSGSTSDDVGSTGATEVHVIGLVENSAGDWVVTEEDVTLDGRSGVNLANSYIRVFRAYVTATGTGKQNAGNIYIGSGTITTGVPANVYAQIQATVGQTLMAIYTTPDINAQGQRYSKCQGLRWYASIGAAQSAFATVAIQGNLAQAGWRTFRTGEVSEGGQIDQVWTFGQLIEPKTDVRIRVLTNGVNNSVVSAGFDLRMW